MPWNDVVILPHPEGWQAQCTCGWDGTPARLYTASMAQFWTHHRACGCGQIGLSMQGAALDEIFVRHRSYLEERRAERSRP